MQGRENRVVIRIALNWIDYYFFFSRKLSQTFGTYILVGVMLTLPVEQLGVCFSKQITRWPVRIGLLWSPAAEGEREEKTSGWEKEWGTGQGVLLALPSPYLLYSVGLQCWWSKGWSQKVKQPKAKLMNRVGERDTTPSPAPSPSVNPPPSIWDHREASKVREKREIRSVHCSQNHPWGRSRSTSSYRNTHVNHYQGEKSCLVPQPFQGACGVTTYGLVTWRVLFHTDVTGYSRLSSQLCVSQHQGEESSHV